jgi:hypothetical protein
MRTLPFRPSTMRTTSGAFPRGGMKSSTRTTPSSDSHVVSSTNVPGRYRRVVLPPPTGATSQRPFSALPSSEAKQAAESKRGKHSQSIEPPRSTSAAVCRSPIRA